MTRGGGYDAGGRECDRRICGMRATGRDRTTGTLLRSLWYYRYWEGRIPRQESIFTCRRSSREHPLTPGSEA